METNQLICRVNQFTGFYMKEILTVTELRNQLFSKKTFGEYSLNVLLRVDYACFVFSQTKTLYMI